MRINELNYDDLKGFSNYEEAFKEALIMSVDLKNDVYVDRVPCCLDSGGQKHTYWVASKYKDLYQGAAIWVEVVDKPHHIERELKVPYGWATRELINYLDQGDIENE